MAAVPQARRHRGDMGGGATGGGDMGGVADGGSLDQRCAGGGDMGVQPVAAT